jgi:hypothetical protein
LVDALLEGLIRAIDPKINGIDILNGRIAGRIHIYMNLFHGDRRFRPGYAPGQTLWARRKETFTFECASASG